MTFNANNLSFTNYTSRIRLPSGSKLAINRKNDNDITTCWHDIIFKICWHCFVFLVKFSYWSKFHVNIITGSGIMIIFFYKGLTRFLEMGNNPVWVLLIIWRLGGGRVPRPPAPPPHSQVRVKHLITYTTSCWNNVTLEKYMKTKLRRKEIYKYLYNFYF